MCTRFLIFRDETCSARSRPHLKHAQQVGGDRLSFQLLWRAATGQDVAVASKNRHRREGMITGTPVEEIRITEAAGQAGLPRRAIQGHGPHHAVGIGERQRPEQHRVNQAKDGRRSADAECQGQSWSERNPGSYAIGGTQSRRSCNKLDIKSPPIGRSRQIRVTR